MARVTNSGAAHLLCSVCSVLRYKNCQSREERGTFE
jgi:hypothetical protein